MTTATKSASAMALPMDPSSPQGEHLDEIAGDTGQQAHVQHSERRIQGRGEGDLH